MKSSVCRGHANVVLAVGDGIGTIEVLASGYFGD